MTMNILRLPQARSFLQAFRCDPSKGSLEIPRVTRPAIEPIQYQVSPQSLDLSDYARARSFLDELTYDVRQLCGEEGTSVVPYTDDTWTASIGRGPDGAQLIEFVSQVRAGQSVNRISLHDYEPDIDIVLKVEQSYRSAAMVYLMNDGKGRAQQHVYYELSVSDYGLTGLRKFMDLPLNANIETIRASLFWRLGVDESGDQPYYPGASRSLAEVVRNRIDAAKEGASLFLHQPIDKIPEVMKGHVENQRISVLASVDEDDVGLRENLTLEFEPATHAAARTFPLPPFGLALWNWLSQAEENVHPDELTDYRALLDLIYSKSSSQSS